MAKRSRTAYKEDGTVEPKGRRYNSKYLLGNILVCGYCGASYRRRTERGKIVWRCATRMEKGRDKCANSPTLKGELIKKILGDNVCGNRSYDEEVVRIKVDNILVFDEYMDICFKNEDKIRIEF